MTSVAEPPPEAPATIAYRVAKRLGVTPPLKRKAIQAKHIPDQEVIDACLAWEVDWEKDTWKLSLWGYAEDQERGDLARSPRLALNENYPDKVVVAKLESMARRGLINPITSWAYEVNRDRPG